MIGSNLNKILENNWSLILRCEAPETFSDIIRREIISDRRGGVYLRITGAAFENEVGPIGGSPEVSLWEITVMESTLTLSVNNKESPTEELVKVAKKIGDIMKLRLISQNEDDGLRMIWGR